MRAIEVKARRILKELDAISKSSIRFYPEHIDAVFVFSGPGTDYRRLKPGQPEWMEWMDRDRINFGVEIVEEIAKNGKPPFFVYAGVPMENKAFRHALDSWHVKLPRSKVIILDDVEQDGDVLRPIRHTGDQTSCAQVQQKF